MVIQDARSLVAFLDQFDPNSKTHFEVLENLLEEHPNFHLIRSYYLKAIQQLHPERFDKTLSHTAIATYDRELLYEFIETQIQPPRSLEENIEPKLDEVEKINPKTNTADLAHKPEKQPEEAFPKTLRFVEWANYLRTNKIPDNQPAITDKFELIDAFLVKQKKITLDKNTENKEDLSEKSWTPTDELMTETLAKVFIKQKKYDNALEAYQILGLKYPEKNSFFADQIKEINRLKKLKD